MSYLVFIYINLYVVTIFWLEACSIFVKQYRRIGNAKNNNLML